MIILRDRAGLRSGFLYITLLPHFLFFVQTTCMFLAAKQHLVLCITLKNKVDSQKQGSFFSKLLPIN